MLARRRIATLLLPLGAIVMSTVAAGLSSAAPASAAGILPPSNPSANIAPDNPDWLTSIDDARSQESVGSMDLSEPALDALPFDQQVLTVVNDERVDRGEQPTVSSLFQAFENLLGPVGAAKALHLLAPRLFPLWDRHIAKAYGLTLGNARSNGDHYWRFMLIAQDQCRDLNRQDPGCQNPLKSIDEYNYCEYTKHWWRDSGGLC